MFRLTGRLFSNSKASKKVNSLLNHKHLPGANNGFSMVDKRGFKHASEPNVLVSSFETLPTPSETLGEYIWKDIEKWADHTALVNGITGREYTYTEIYKMSRTFAASLRNKLKLNDGDCVAVMMPNCPDYALSILGSMQAGCIVTPINPLYKADEIANQITISKTKALVTIAEFYGECKKALQIINKSIPIVVSKLDPRTPHPEGAIKFSEFSENFNEDTTCLKYVKRTIDDTVLLPFSSGTTGLPKGVELTNKNLTCNMAQMSYINPTPTSKTYQDTVIGLLPFFHIYGLSCVLLNKLCLGWKIVTLPQFQPDLFLSTQEKYKSTMLFVVPPMVLFLNTYPKVTAAHLDSIITTFSAAAPLAASDVERLISKFNINLDIIQGYGMSETSPLVCLQDRGNKNYAAVGKLLNNTEAKIVKLDDFNVSLGPRQEGELWVRGPQVMKGYLENPASTKEALQPDGWLRTGDIGYYDENEEFYITDRLKELIKVKGFPVAPAELEAVLRNHPDIVDAAVIGVPHPQFGEMPKGFVVKKPNSSPSTDEIMKYMEEKVADYKKLGDIQFVESIPRSVAGKILRKDIKAKFLS